MGAGGHPTITNPPEREKQVAVVSISARGIGCSGSAKQGAEGKTSKTYRANYRVTCDSVLDTAPLVYAYLEANRGTAPWFGNTLSLGNGSDASVTCDDITVDPIEGAPGLFNVTVGFSPTDVPKDGGGELTIGGKRSDDPLDWADDIDVTFTQTSVVAEFGIFHGFFDTAGNPSNAQLAIGNKIKISNSAEMAYDPPIEEEKQIKVIRISRNVPEYDDAFFDLYQGAVNSDKVTIYKSAYRFRAVLQPLTALARIGCVFNIINEIRHYRQTLEIWVDQENWRRKLLDKGQQRSRKAGDPNGTGGTYSSSDMLSAGNAPYIQLADPTGLPLSSPVALDGKGAPKNVAGGVDYYGIWQTKREIPFAPLAGRAW